MPSLSALPKVVIALALAAAAGAGVTAIGPALASNAHAAGSAAAQHQLGLVAPTARSGRLSPAAAGKAVSTCVNYAARAGWPDNGYFGGDLVTAATICVAESGGDPNLIVCDNASGGITGQGDFPKFTCPKGTFSFDRGLWQLNTVALPGVGPKCAFSPVCNAGQAYLHSGRGTNFSPWSSYDNDTYAGPFLDLVQAAVTKHVTGTVTSALLGECLAPAGARVVIANCGSGAVSQLWSTAGGKLKSGSRCATLASSGRAVVLGRCAGQKAQDWTAFGRNELRNASDGKCLTDPGSSLAAGTQLEVANCASAKAQTWWLP